MGKPMLILDNDFLVDIYGRSAAKGIPTQFDKQVGENILDDLLKKYDVRITRTCLNESAGQKFRASVGDWFNLHQKQGDIKIYETEPNGQPAFTGKDKGEKSIAALFDPSSPFHDPDLPKDPSKVQFASRDQNFFGAETSSWKPFTQSTQAVLEQGLADGTIPQDHYEGVLRISGDALKRNGGLKTPEQVYAEYGRPPTAEAPAAQPQEKPPAPETPTAPSPPPETALQEGSLIEAAGRNSKFAANVGKRPSVGGVGAPAVGLVLGVQGVNDAIHRGDKVEGMVAGVNLTTSSVQTAEVVLDATGKTLPVIAKAGKFVPGLNVAATVADGVYQVSKEDTTEHKVERATVVGATAATALTVGAATATAGEAAAITGGVTAVLGTGAAGATVAAAAVAAAPVVLAVAAAGAVAYVGEKAIESKRAWDDVDKQIAEEGKAEKRQNYTSPDGKPTILGYKHIAVAMQHVSGEMKNENLNGTGGLARDTNGRFKLDDIKKIDMRDPKNIAELERVLTSAIAKDDKIIKDNDSIIPKGWRFFSQDAVDKMTNAQRDEADLKGAMQEIQMYKKELADYDKAHPDSPATTQPAAIKPKSKGPQQP